MTASLLDIGRRIELGRHTFTAAEIKDFAGRWDPQRFHVDEEAAAASHFGALCASGWHTAAMWMRYEVASMTAELESLAAEGTVAPVAGPALGLKDIRWLRPVFAGDTIAYSRIATARRPSNSRPGWEIVTLLAEAHNQDGVLVMKFESAVLVRP